MNKFLFWVLARWAEPSTKRGVTLLLGAGLSRALPPDMAEGALALTIGLAGLQGAVTADLPQESKTDAE